MNKGIEEKLLERSEWMMRKLESLDSKVDDLMAFRFRTAGIFTFIGAIAATVVHIFLRLI